MKNILHWLLVSSEDPTKMSLTVKGALTGLVPILISIVGLTHFNVSTSSINSAVDTISLLTQDVLYIVFYTATTWGLLRKIKNSIHAKSIKTQEAVTETQSTTA